MKFLEKMNILIVYPHGNALNPHSGAETRIWNLVSAFTERDYNVSILHSNKSQGFEDIELKKNAMFIIIESYLYLVLLISISPILIHFSF